MARSLAVVFTVMHTGSTVRRAAERLATAGVPVLAVPYAQAGVAALRALCAPLGIACADEAHATWPAAANAGAGATHGDVIVFLDGAQPPADGFEPLLAALAEARGGITGPAESGIVLAADPLTMRGFALLRAAHSPETIDADALDRDCFAIARTTFADLGGIDDRFGAELGAIDLCLRAGERGGRVLAVAACTIVRTARTPEHDELLAYREDAFTQRWRERAEPRENFWPERHGNTLLRRFVHGDGIGSQRLPVPATTLVVHGDAAIPDDFSARLAASRMQPASIVWAAPGPPPPGARVVTDVHSALRDVTEARGWDYIAFVRSDTLLGTDWLNELVNVLERAPQTLAATVTGNGPPAIGSLPTADARCTLVAPSMIPQHIRVQPAPSIDAALAAWLAWGVNAGRTIVPVTHTATRVGASPLVALPPAHTEPEPFASIIMLSWNAIEYTEQAVASIRAHTRVPHEIIIIDNGSDAETVARLRAIDGITIIANAVNTGFAFACNQGLAAGRGTHLVLLNNDVVVTGGWLDALIAVQQRNPAVGCSAPRTNRIAGMQQIDDVPYDTLDEMAAFAARRADAFAGAWTNQLRVVGFCMCLDRRLVDELGGLDPRFGAGNFEDDDYCVRIKSAGYDIAVCEDAFIHHFGSVTFRANAIDYAASIERNKAIFAARWNTVIRDQSYDPHTFHRAYDRTRDYVPLPEPAGVGADWQCPA